MMMLMIKFGKQQHMQSKLYLIIILNIIINNHVWIHDKQELYSYSNNELRQYRSRSGL